MNRIHKLIALVVAVVLLPVAAYAAGNLTASDEEPTPRRDIAITETPTPAPRTGSPDPRDPDDGDARPPRERVATKGGRDGRVLVVTPRPAPVNGGDDDGGDDRDDDGGDDRDDDDRGDDDGVDED